MLVRENGEGKVEEKCQERSTIEKDRDGWCTL